MAPASPTGFKGNPQTGSRPLGQAEGVATWANTGQGAEGGSKSRRMRSRCCSLKLSVLPLCSISCWHGVSLSVCLWLRLSVSVSF